MRDNLEGDELDPAYMMSEGTARRISFYPL